MNPLQLMEMHRSDFTPNDLVIYQAILENPDQVVYKTTSRLAEDCGVSQPALSRFVKTLGYNRYQDFRADVSTWLAVQAEQTAQGSNHTGYFHRLYQLLQNSEKLLTPAYLQELAQYINNHANIYATGLAKSFQPAQLFEILMRKKRRTVRAVANDFLGETSAYMDDNDLLILFSVSGRSEIMQSIQHTTGKILLITANPHPACAEKIDRSRPWVIVTNHQSMLDIPLMYVLPTTFKWVSKKEVQKMPVFGWVLWMHGDIPVERGSRGSAKQMLDRCRQRLSRGTSVIVFPEGTRTKTGEIGRFKDGAFLVAKHAGVGIQPVVIDGTWSLNDGWRLRMPHTFRVKVLDALPAEYVASKEARELAVEMENRMRTAHLQMTGKQQ